MENVIVDSYTEALHNTCVMLDEFVYSTSTDAYLVPDLIVDSQSHIGFPLHQWSQLSVIAVLHIVIADCVMSLMDTLGNVVIGNNLGDLVGESSCKTESIFF